MSTEIREVKSTASESIQATLPEGETFVRPTVLFGKPYIWITKRNLQFCLRPWPEGLELKFDV